MKTENVYMPLICRQEIPKCMKKYVRNKPKKRNLSLQEQVCQHKRQSNLDEAIMKEETKKRRCKASIITVNIGNSGTNNFSA
jgi:hypothetical protein